MPPDHTHNVQNVKALVYMRILFYFFIFLAQSKGPLFSETVLSTNSNLLVWICLSFLKLWNLLFVVAVLQARWSGLVQGHEREEHESGCGFEQLDCPFPKVLLPGCQGSGLHAGSGVPSYGHGHQAAHNVSSTKLVKVPVSPSGPGSHSCPPLPGAGSQWACRKINCQLTFA